MAAPIADVSGLHPNLVTEISSMVEEFVTDLKRGRLGAGTGEESNSLSTSAAVQMIAIMGKIVELFQEYEEKSDSQTVQLLRSGCSAKDVASNQVLRLLQLVTMAGDAMLRSQFCVLLLMNVTRRILSILREAADRSRAQESDLEKEAKTILDDVGYDEEDTPVNSPHSSSTTELSPSPVTRKEGGLQRSGKRGFSVKFAERLDEHNYSAPTMQKELTPASPLMKRTSSAIAGQMVLKRAPSKRAHSDDDGNSFPVLASKFYEEAQGGIADFREEVEGMTNELCKRACRQLHSSDTIITMGCTNTTRRYLVEAAAARVAFRVIILEGAPSNPSAVENLAKELRAYNIDVQVLPDSSTFVVMSVSTKVLVAAESVLANGGMLAAVGTHMLCVAARHSAVPVLVATTTLKMSPYYPNDQLCTRLVRIARTGAQEMPWSTYGSTESILPLSHGVSVGDGGKGFVVHSPVTEYVPPELVTLYASNDTEFMPSQIHRFVRANYNDFD